MNNNYSGKIRKKIIIFGEENVGKSTLVNHLNPGAKSIEHTRVNGETITVGCDIGKIEINNYLLYFFGTPGQVRFEFARQIVSRGAHMGLLLIDSEKALKAGISDREKAMEQELIDWGIPYLICANKQDAPSILPVLDVQTHFSSHVHPISAQTGNGVDALKDALVAMLDAQTCESKLYAPKLSCA